MANYLAFILVTLSAIFLGSNFNAGKEIVEHLSPLTAAAIRFSLASLMILPLIFLRVSIPDMYTMIRRNLGIYLVLGVIGIAGFNGFFFMGLKHTTAINGALIMATNPLVSMIMASLLLKETLYMNQRVGFGISFLGVLVVITHGSLDTLLHVRIALGDGLIMLGNLCWASYGVLGRRYLQQAKPLITTGITMTIGALALLVMTSYDMNPTEIIHQSGHIYALLFYIALFGTVLAYLFWNYGLHHLGVSKTVVFFNLVPVVTVIISVVMGHPITGIQIIGGLAVIFGVALSTNAIKFPFLDTP